MLKRFQNISCNYFLAVTCLLFLACTPPARKPDTISVVTTLFPLYDFSRQVGGEQVDVSLLLPPGVEAHTYEPTPGDMLRIDNADVFIYTGDQMEPWVTDMLAGLANTNLLVIDASKNIPLISTCSDTGHDHGADDHEHGAVDPHIWLDPLNARTMVGTITDAFSRKDPEHRDEYQAQASPYAAQLEALDRDISNTISRCTHRVLLCGGHYTFGYFARRYGLTHMSPYRGFSPNAEPTAKRVTELIKTMKARKLKYIFHEELIDPKVARVIAEETGARLLLLHGAHNVSKQDLRDNISYISIMRANRENLKTGLEYK